MIAQRILDIHSPESLQDVDTILAMQFPRARITRRAVFAEGTMMCLGYEYVIRHCLLRRERVFVKGLMGREPWRP